MSAIVCALISFLHRYSAESRNRRVEIVVDWSDAQALANTNQGKLLAIDDILKTLKSAGVTSIAVIEDTLETLRGSGTLSYKLDGKTTVMTFAKGYENQLPRVLSALTQKTRLIVKQTSNNELTVDAPWPQFNGTPIGLADDVVKTVRTNHLLVAPRLYNYTGVSASSINRELDQVQKQCGANGTGPIIFTGSAVLGNRPLIKVTADALRSHGMTYGSVEFAKTLGDEDLSRMAADRTVRVHSIGVDEMGTMEEPTAQERFVRAARERNIRVCYVRLFINGLVKHDDVVEANTSYLNHIVDGLHTARLNVGDGPAHPWADNPTPSRISRMIIGLGVMAGLILLVELFTGWRGRSYLYFTLTLLLLGLVLGIPEKTMKAREILALLAACTFPSLALCLVMPNKNLSTQTLTVMRVQMAALASYVKVTAITSIGALYVVGLLSGRLFFLKVDEFLGVKAVLVVPVLVAAAFYSLGIAELRRDAPWSERKRTAKQRIDSVLSQPILLRQLLIGLVAIVALALFVARSGNDPGVGVSATELKMRALLDKYLLVRPRTKEFLLGHPALYLAYAAAVCGKFKRWVLPLVVIGAIGQASIVDTFCHLHTPLQLSMLRAAIGWAIGGIIAAVIVAIVLKTNRSNEAAAN